MHPTGHQGLALLPWGHRTANPPSSLTLATIVSHLGECHHLLPGLPASTHAPLNQPSKVWLDPSTPCLYPDVAPHFPADEEQVHESLTTWPLPRWQPCLCLPCTAVTMLPFVKLLLRARQGPSNFHSFSLIFTPPSTSCTFAEFSARSTHLSSLYLTGSCSSEEPFCAVVGKMESGASVCR